MGGMLTDGAVEVDGIGGGANKVYLA